jgi:Helix-turn-helix domain
MSKLEQRGIVAMAWRWRSMKGISTRPSTLSAAQRGQIVQRVIVDGWTIADAAAAVGLPERFVAGWVADFRRHGMTSLRHRPRKTVAAEFVHRRFLRPAGLVFRAAAIGGRWLFASRKPAPPSPIRRSQDDRRGGS